MRKGSREVRSHTPQPIIRPRGGTHQQKQPSGLWICHSWDAFKQSRMFLRFSLQEALHELGLSNRNPQDFQPLLARWQRRIPSPHNGIRSHASCCSGEDVDPPKLNSCSVPHLSLAMVQRNLCMIPQFLLQNSVDLEHPVWRTDDVMSSRKTNTFSLGNNLRGPL